MMIVEFWIEEKKREGSLFARSTKKKFTEFRWFDYAFSLILFLFALPKIISFFIVFTSHSTLYFFHSTMKNHKIFFFCIPNWSATTTKKTHKIKINEKIQIIILLLSVCFSLSDTYTYFIGLFQVLLFISYTTDLSLSSFSQIEVVPNAW